VNELERFRDYRGFHVTWYTKTVGGLERHEFRARSKVDDSSMRIAATWPTDEIAWKSFCAALDKMCAEDGILGAKALDIDSSLK